jgi:hypothetical protein
MTNEFDLLGIIPRGTKDELELELANNQVTIARLQARNLEISHQIRRMYVDERTAIRNERRKVKEREHHIAHHRRMGLNPDMYDYSGRVIKEGDKLCEEHHLIECKRCTNG